MAELLLELFSEEIPARMQLLAAADLLALLKGKLDKAKLAYTSAQSFVTPRRLTLHVTGLPEAQPNVSEERRGPRVGAPDAAVQGFLKGAGLLSLAECEERDTGKGVFYFAVIETKGRRTREVLPELLRQTILDLPWPKSMRFPAAPFRWVRPLSRILSIFEGRVLPIDFGFPVDVPVGDTTSGHRFLAPAQFDVTGFADYAEKLRAGYVILDPVARRQKIADDLALMAKGEGLRLKDDPGLLDEVTGLVEFPVVLAGRIEPEFMDLPQEVLTTSMRAHQKYFALTDAAGALAPKFLVVANNLTADGGATIVAGNQRVLRARLSDAKFFWDHDRKVPLESRVAKLAERIFHARLGSVLAKVERVERLVDAIAPHVEGADAALAKRAARLAKADLSTGMVGEFPELQGVMGRYYAIHDGEPQAIADAIAEHYSPLGPNDRCPTVPTSVVVALADKIDTLAGFFAIDEKPTGSKDPYALRRAALGVIRLILENKLRVALRPLLTESCARILDDVCFGVSGGIEFANRLCVKYFSSGILDQPDFNPVETIKESQLFEREAESVTSSLLDFFADRLKVHLREKGVRHDLIAAIFALGGEDDLVRLLARVAALDEFLKSEDGANLLTAYRRASNIVRIEEKKDGRAYTDAPDPAQMREAAETALAERLLEVERLSSAALGNEEFGVAMAALARLRRPVDEFFNHVTVNSEDASLRVNRLRLLSQIRATLNQVADFAQIEG